MSAVFVDYDNIYLSLKRKSEEAAKRFAKDAVLWIKEIENGRLITPTHISPAALTRRIVMNRCYGNPVPRRNNTDNSTDMNSFPFVRHHYLRAGFEVVDCPPLTAQLKNSADIRMVMDVRDLLDHQTYFDEFVILSGDADFTPLLHRLRAHARRTVVFANDHTAAPYTALSDGEVREQDLINLLLEGRLGAEAPAGEQALLTPAVRQIADMSALSAEIIREVVALVRSAGQPVPLEALADRAVRTLGHDRTVGSNWAGLGGFRELLSTALPHEIRLTDQPPYFVFDTARQIVTSTAQRQAPAAAPRQAVDDAARPVATDAPRQALNDAPRQVINEPASQMLASAPVRKELAYEPTREPRIEARMPAVETHVLATPAAVPAPALTPAASASPQPGAQVQYASLPAAALGPQTKPAAPRPQFGLQPADAAPAARSTQAQSAIHQSITRIQEACQAPVLSPEKYRALFEVMAEEINTNNLTGNQTFVNIDARALELGVEFRRDDVRFVLDVVSEPDPWFEQGASANLFSSRFRNFVVARCRSQALNLSADELDLIEAWFGGSPIAQRAAAVAAPEVQPQQQRAPAAPPQMPQQPAQAAPAVRAPAPAQTDSWWSLEEGREHVAPARASGPQDDEFPRIIRSRLRG